MFGSCYESEVSTDDILTCSRNSTCFFVIKLNCSCHNLFALYNWYINNNINTHPEMTHTTCNYYIGVFIYYTML